MKKISLFITLCLTVPAYMSAQIPPMKIMEDYKKMAIILEQIEQPISDQVFYLPVWKKDSLIGLRDEITMFHFGKEWKDSLQIMEKDSIFYAKIKKFPNDSTLVLAKYGSKKPAKGRKYYENKRLEKLTQIFDTASQKNNKIAMESVLDIMVYYYYNPELLTDNKNKENYKNGFIAMRQKYSFFLFECYQKNICKKKDISLLFWYCTKLYPDTEMAKSVLNYVYDKEKKYLLFNGSSSEISFPNTAEYFLSLLQLYNIKGIDNKTKADILLRAYRNLFDLKYITYEKDWYQKNMKRYLKEKYDIHP